MRGGHSSRHFNLRCYSIRARRMLPIRCCRSLMALKRTAGIIFGRSAVVKCTAGNVVVVAIWSRIARPRTSGVSSAGRTGAFRMLVRTSSFTVCISRTRKPESGALDMLGSGSSSRRSKGVVIGAGEGVAIRIPPGSLLGICLIQVLRLIQPFQGSLTILPNTIRREATPSTSLRR
jgi:hypothetical protein